MSQTCVVPEFYTSAAHVKILFTGVPAYLEDPSLPGTHRRLSPPHLSFGIYRHTGSSRVGKGEKPGKKAVSTLLCEGHRLSSHSSRDLLDPTDWYFAGSHFFFLSLPTPPRVNCLCVSVNLQCGTGTRFPGWSVRL